MTKPRETIRCRWCGRKIDAGTGPGRPREFCKDSCKQMDYQSRRRSAELGLNESELVMAREELEQLRDAIFVLEAAVEDVDRDLAEAGDDPAEVRQALDWLLEAARALVVARP